MLIKKSLLRTTLVFLVGLFTVCGFTNCKRANDGDEIKKATEIIKEYAMKANPALRGQKLRVSMDIDGTVNEVCACIQVCDSKGQNCTACSCSPKNCGSCE
jgi:hypothetical protein